MQVLESEFKVFENSDRVIREIMKGEISIVDSISFSSDEYIGTIEKFKSTVFDVNTVEKYEKNNTYGSTKQFLIKEVKKAVGYGNTIFTVNYAI